jgi:hypothetical protein
MQMAGETESGEHRLKQVLRLIVTFNFQELGELRIPKRYVHVILRTIGARGGRAPGSGLRLLYH